MQIRFKNPWWVVVGAVSGLIVCNGPVLAFTFGVFLKPIMADMHWDRGTASFALSFGELFGAITVPVLGVMMDRWSIRRVALPGIVAFAACLGLLGLTPHSLAVFMLFFAMVSIAGSIQTPLGYTKAIAAWFDRRRGLALGIAMSGVGLGTTIIPPLVAYFIGAYGWRLAYVGLAAVVLVVPGLAVAFCVREPSAADRRARPGLEANMLRGVTMREALRSWRFYALVTAFLLGVVCLNGTLTQIVAMLMDRGYTLPAAARVLAASGMAAIVGRVLSGWLVDRFHGPHVAVGFFILPMIGTALFGSGAGGYVPVAGALLCGAALGAEIDLMGFFVSRYFGLKSYGKIFGTLFGCFAGATGVGPFLSGLSHDLYGTYVPAFALYEVLLVIACLIFLPLGPYPFPALHRLSAEPVEGQVAT